MQKFLLVLGAWLLLLSACAGQPAADMRVRTGAEVLLADSMSLLQGKRIAVIANQTSRIGNTHLIDTLIARGVDVVRIFAPEHGFRGNADAGEHVANGRDVRTGVPIVSLYGANKKPTQAQLADVDIVLFDIQDVGTRHYTYLATLCLAMEQCAHLGKTFVVLDRPNPNGSYVDGPVMESAYTSFIGAHAGVPIVHGMTLGEYARMVCGEQWHTPEAQNQHDSQPVKAYKTWQGLRVICCQGYKHAMRWRETGLPWIAPSPNLATINSAEWYPFLCWYEAATMSVGRGTDSAFEVVGAPWLRTSSLSNITQTSVSACVFTPRSLAGRAKNPPFLGEQCYGLHFASEGSLNGSQRYLAAIAQLEAFYAISTEKKASLFFDTFETWSGTATLRYQIKTGVSPQEIHDNWQPNIASFLKIRAKYLLYP